MPYGTIYRIKFDWKEAQDIASLPAVVYICDVDTFDVGATTTYIDLEGSETPFELSVIDNDRSKWQTIRAKQADIYFLSEAGKTAKTFSVGADNRWYVIAFIETTSETIFQG